MISTQDVKQAALAMGADMVGIGSIDRWEGAPLQMDPRQIMPEAKSVIGMVFRVMRGSLRGIEEGTYFSNYSAMGYGGITYLYMPMTVINLAKMIEDHGYEAVPYGHQSDWRGIDNEGRLRPQYSRPVAPGRAFPDVMIHLRFAAFLCGLGEIGYSKMFLSPRFGPRNRVGVILTDAELEPDPLYDGPPLCDQCMACVKNCPGQAIDSVKTVKVKLAGREVEWGELDCSACGIAFRGAMVNDELPAEQSYDSYDEMYGHHTEPGPWSPFYRKPRNLYNTGQAVCGGRGCVRACMMNLEARGVLENKFHSPFRRRKPWRVDWSQLAPEPPTDEVSEITGQEAD
jgi:ferredoxin